ncbi:MAG TPA: hypothetical protein VFH29_02535 [Anaerolineales bacterium]|nr:hypothetical protein [Anaerolineales bacterium]
MSSSRIQLGFLMAVLLLSGCTSFVAAPAGAPVSVSAWFDAPLPRTVFYPPNPCQFIAHGASPKGIALFELTINGGPAKSIPSPDSKTSLSTLQQDCGVTAPGEYNVRLRAQDTGGSWSGYAETSFIIGAPRVVEPSPTPLPAAPSRATVAPPPTGTASPVPAGGVSIESVSTGLVYAGADTCGPVSVTIVARATAPLGIQVVVLFYRFEPGSPAGFQNVAMSPIGGDRYQASINPTATLGGPADATLQYQVVVQQVGGDTSIRTPVLADVAVQACGSAAADCSSYGDKRACERNGCSWAAGPGIVPVYSCRNP